MGTLRRALGSDSKDWRVCMTQYVYGKNTVKQLLKEEKKIYEVLLVEGLQDKEMNDLLHKRRVKVVMFTRKQMDKKFKEVRHQGVAALIDDYKTYDIDTILAAIPQGKTPLLVLLDGLEDPHNLGAILRSCDCAGVDGVILSKHRNVKLTPTVAKVSTGAIDTVKVAIVTNLVQTIKQLKEKGFWVVGADLCEAKDYREGHYDVPCVLVIGSEGFGISSLVRKNCDYCVKLPMMGKISSLNASVACGILLYQILHQRNPL